jgi:hypothetical protein
MCSLATINPEQLESRLATIRREILNLELGLRGLVRIAGQATDDDAETMCWALCEIEALGNLLVKLADTTGSDLEAGQLKRWAATAGEEANDEA